MAKGLWKVLALGALMIWAKVESPSLHYTCGDGEYYYSGICCKNCPAGTHVDEPCSMPHTSGHCATCTEGEDYTAHENGLEKCLQCDECKPGRTMVKACTVKSNTECQCNDGYYCPPNCEECLRCKTTCPEGQVIVQKCNATVDMKCGPSPTGPLLLDHMPVLYIVLCAVILSLIILIGFLIPKCRVPCRKEEKMVKNDFRGVSTDVLWPKWRNSNTDALQNESEEVQPSIAEPTPASSYSDLPESIDIPLSNAEEESSSGAAPLLCLRDKPVTHNIQSNVLPSNPECPAATKPSHVELCEICSKLINKMRVNDWKMLMRTAGLSENEIDIITHDYPYDTREQMHRMLKTLYDYLGPDKALCKLLNGLQQMKLIHIYENVRNELLSKSIMIVEGKGKCLYLVKNAEQNL